MKKRSNKRSHTIRAYATAFLDALFRNNNWSRRDAYAVFGTALCALVLFLGLTFFGRADVASFYFTSCLGEWANVHAAEGKPETLGQAATYDATNSATIAGKTGSIFCGKLEGDVPKDTFPAGVTLRLAWHVSEETAPEVFINQEALTPEGAIPSTVSPEQTEAAKTAGEALGTTPDTTTTDTTNSPASEETTTPSSDTTGDIPTQPSAPVDAPASADAPAASSESAPASSGESSSGSAPSAPVSLRFFDIAYAEETTTPISVENNTVDTTQTEAITTETVTSDTETSTSTTTIATSTSDTNASSSSEVITGVVEDPDEAFVEVLYSLDGVKWESLGRVNKDSVEETAFSIPVTSWEDLQKIQISIQMYKNISDRLTLYLDSAWIEANATVLAPAPELPTDVVVYSSEGFITPQNDDLKKIPINSPDTRNTCSVDPFSQTVPRSSGARYEIFLKNHDEQYVPFRLRIANLPLGVTARFSVESVSEKKDRYFVELLTDGSVAPSSVSMSILYDMADGLGSYTSVLCPLNMVTTP